MSGTGLAGRARGSRGVQVLTTVVLVAAAMSYPTITASSSPVTAFEITDANITDSPSGAPYDWSALFGAGGAPTSTGSFDARSFVADPISSDPLPGPPVCAANKTGDPTVFTSGGSDKNADAISTWTYESGSVPNSKDDLTNVYAAATKDGADLVFYYALERANENGASHADFEFLRSSIGLQQGTDKDGNPKVDSSGCPSGNFAGSRQIGDLLISMNWDHGGTVGIEDVRTWNGSTYVVPTNPDGTPKSLVGLVGIVQNSDPIDCGAWTCRDRIGASVTELPSNAFAEGFINVSQILGANVGCFSSFNAKTRSSHEYNSELKDFALGSFNTCDARITLTPNGVNAVGTNHTFTAKVETNDTGAYAAKANVLVTGTTSHGSFVGGTNTCTTNASGQCALTITSSAAGTSTVNVSATVPLASGASVFRSTATAPGPSGSGPATKHWVDAYIKVTPDDVNPVNDSHTFTFEYGVLGATATGLSVGSVSITPTITAVGGSPAPTTESNSCTGPPSQVGTTNVWRCAVRINSSSTGVYSATASGTSTVTMTGTPTPVPALATLPRSTTSSATHGPGGNTGATKTYVDARLSITPDGLNQVSVASANIDDPHTITATVENKIGNGAWVPAATNTLVTFTLGAGSAGAFVAGSTCLTNALGQCSVQINSTSSGTSTVSASTTVTTATTPAVAMLRTSSSITKHWVDAVITILQTDTNEINDDHEFTITVTPIKPSAVTVDSVVITPSVSPTSTNSTTCGATTPVVLGVATCTYTVNSATPGLFDVDATTTLNYSWNGFTQAVSRSTTGYSGPNGNAGATKTFVDARVSLGNDGVNKVNDAHDVTGLAEYNDGTGWKPAVGKTITFSETSDTAASGFVGGVSTCVADSSGHCTVQIVSATSGVTWINASTNYAVDGVTMTRTSATTATDPANLRKEWVDAKISITPSEVNEVGDQHVFNILVTATAASAGIVIAPPTSGVTPSQPLTSNTLVCSATVQNAGTGATRSCTLTINSSTAGVFTANASTRVTIGEVVFDLTTNGQGANSGPATKTYVDARIKLANDGVNEVNDPHPVAATVEVNDGAGWDAAPEGVTVTLLETGPGAIPATCTTTADSVGTCVVSLTSATAGVSTVHASVTTTVLGEIITRETSTALNTAAGGSGDLTKRWVDGSVRITPDGVNKVGDAHSFTVTATANPSGAGAPTFAITPSVTPAPGTMTTTCATPTISGDTATCSVTINSAATGSFVANATATIGVGGVTIVRSTNATVAPSGPNGSGPAGKIYVDAFITIGETAVNPVNAPHTFTVRVNALPATAAPVVFGPITTTVTPAPGTVSSTCATPVVSGNTATCTLTVNSSVAGVFVANATANLSIGGTALIRSTNASVATAGPGGSGPATKTYEVLQVLGEVVARPAAVAPELPRTGVDALRLLAVAMLLLVSGACLLAVVRRPRDETA